MWKNNIKLLIDSDASDLVQMMTIEMALRIGQECIAIDFPVVQLREEHKMLDSICYIHIQEEKEQNLLKIVKVNNLITFKINSNVYDEALKYLVENFTEIINATNNEKLIKLNGQANTSIDVINDLDKVDLDKIFTSPVYFEDTNNDFMPDKVNLKLHIDNNVSISEVIAASNIAARIGLSTLGITYPILTSASSINGIIKITKADKAKFYADIKNDIENFILEGSGQELISLSNYIANNFPDLQNGTWADYLQSLESAIKGENYTGQIVYLNSLIENKTLNLNEKVNCYFESKIDTKADEIAKYYNDISKNIIIDTYKGEKVLIEKEYDIKWEVDTLKELLEKEVYNKVNKNDKVEILGLISEPIEVRNDIHTQILEKLNNIGVKTVNCEIISSYKQGYSWINEKVLPKIKNKNITNITIEFSSLLPEGVTSWGDEDGATPTTNRRKTDDNNNWLDAPVRFLQELYPIDDILATELNIPRENISFALYDGKDDITYRVIAYNNDNVLYENSYKVLLSERAYLNEFKGFGLVHPSTGRLLVKINDNITCDLCFKTDLENVWDIYQNDVLPLCRKHIESISKTPDASYQPFFSQLRLDLNLSEPDDKLNTRKDLMSALNAFHEDIYFVGADYFKSLGLEKCGVAWDCPGMILPVINKAIGKPKFKFSLIDKIFDEATIVNADKTIKLKANYEDLNVKLHSIELNKGGLIGNIEVNCSKSENRVQDFLENYVLLFDKGICECYNLFNNFDIIRITIDNKKYEIKPVKSNISKDININDIDFYQDEVIGYDEYQKIISQLEHVKGLEIKKIATSYEGRAIHSVEFTQKYSGRVSTLKLINERPTHLINNRHHANEVSSTTGSFMLIKELLNNKNYEFIHDKVSLVIIPFENPDGAAIHHKLQKDNPEWQLHIARFNAIGKEFAYDYFKEDTIHTEAHAFTNAWYKWLPDVCTDNHGVPKHEWDQQFSGYISPWFKGFWLPRSLWYGYFWYVDEEKYSDNMQICKGIQKAISGRLNGDNEISAWNIEWRDRFEKYGHNWMPKLFPANYEDNLIYYWVPYKANPNNFYASIKFPWITGAFLTSEIADETAQGDYLVLCARTHMQNDLAVIDTLANARCEYDILNNDYTYKKVRKRPIQVSQE